MKGIHILATGRALPRKVVSNDEMSTFVDTSDEWIRSRTGIGQRHVCEEESCVSLAVEAANDALAKAIKEYGITKEEIGILVVATTTPDYAFPSAACMVQKELDLPKEVISFDISAACSGFLYGLDVCRGLLITGEKKYALLIGSEQLSRIMDYTDRSSCVIFGDGAGAAILELSDKLYVQKSWSSGDQETLFCKGIGQEESYLHMDGNKVFRFAVQALSESMVHVMEQAGLTMDDVDYVICHQANARIIEHIRKKYPDHRDKFYMNIEHYGNTSAASIPIAMDEMFELNRLKEGMKVICISFGAGFTWSGALFEL